MNESRPPEGVDGAATGPQPDGGSAVRDEPAGSKGGDPVRLATLIVLAVSVVFFGLYLRADRVTPYSDQARLGAYAVPIVPQVSGYVTDIEVSLHEVVEPAQVLVRIDTTQYQIAVRSARAALDNAIQQLGVQSASVESAAARLAAARAQETIARRDYDRVQQISDRNASALSQADRDRAAAASSQASAQVESAEAELRRAQAQLGVDGEGNPTVRSAMAGLEQAEFDVAQTIIRAPSRGGIESLQLDVGHFAAAGQPLMTFVSTADVWIEADMRENNLANLKPGDPVEVILDVAPGRVFDGTVRTIGYGVRQSARTSRGELPQVSQETGWLRQPQRFPVIIGFTDNVPAGMLRVGAQASVIVYTGNHFLLNPLGRLVIRLLSLLSYAR